jgi:thioredoxin-like negative regulator of GroEL
LKDSTEKEKLKTKKRSKRSTGTETMIQEVFGSNFKTAVSGKVSLVSFCVPWCQSCQKILSSMINLRHHFKESDVNLARIDCNNDLNSDVCFNELVNGA